MRRASSALVLLALTGCERPSALVVCHNGNCADPHDVSRDDTVEALRASLALEVDGRPPFDGVELDLIFDDGRCWYAHDANDLAAGADPAEAAALLVDHLRANPAVEAGERFVLFLELKPQVGEPDRFAHADCALTLMTQVRTTALEVGYDLDVIFDSYDPALLGALQRRPDRPVSDDRTRIRFAADFGIPAPVGSDSQTLDAYGGLELDVASIHPSWTTHTLLRALRSKNLDLSAWVFDVTRETLDVIESLEPTYIVTGQARLLRRWLDD